MQLFTSYLYDQNACQADFILHTEYARVLGSGELNTVNPGSRYFIETQILFKHTRRLRKEFLYLPEFL